MANVRRLSCLASVVIALVGCGGGGGGGAATAASTLCDQLVACGQVPSQFRSMCVTQFEVYVPDPTAAKECVDGLSLTCADLSNDTAIKSVASTCFFDTSKSTCSGTTTTLTVCSPVTQGHASVCKDLSCPTVCSQLGASSSSCGLDGTDPWDKCLCYL